MTRYLLVLVVPAVVLGQVAQSSAAPPKLPEGRVYVLHSDAIGACPSLDWHIVVERNDVLAGMVAWGNMRSMARATGKVDRENGTFRMNVVELGGRGRKAAIEGTIGDNGTATATIKGAAVTCDSVMIRSFVDPDGK